MTRPTIPSQSRPADLDEYLRREDEKPLLRFLACGAVDAGKSTLLGRLLFEAGRIFDDQLATLRQDSARHGTTGDDLDLALLLDGLSAEREQGITIDVAYRSFATNTRRFLVADTPGHEEYTRNTATGASTAALTVVVVDARQGMTSQTKRHTLIASLLGIRHLVIAVNKIDLVSFGEAKFKAIGEDFERFAGPLGFATIQAIPVSARSGDNVARRSADMPWYEGPTLIQQLETVPLGDDRAARPFRYPVQHVLRPDGESRGLAGQVASGGIAVGDPVVVAKSGQQSRVRQILTMDGPLASAVTGQSVSIVLEDQLDVSRGDMLADPRQRPEVADQFQAHLLWFGSEPLMPGRTYILRTECDSVDANVTRIKHVINVDTLAHGAAQSMAMNDIGVCNVYLQAPIAFDAYRDNHATGNFVLIDRLTHATVGAGMIDFALRRARNVRPQAIEVSRQARSALMQQRPAVVWLTGLSASGKSTIANALEKQLHAAGYHTTLLDGDNIRHGLNRDLGFTDADRVENIRRVAEVAKLMTDAGLIVIVSFISPFRSERQLARELMEEGEFIEVFVDTPIEECMLRDPKGLYRRAIAGEIVNFTGIDSPYEAPERPELHLQTTGAEPSDLAASIMAFLGLHPRMP